MEDNNAARNLCLGFLAGAVVGAAIGLLCAPQSGAETREMLAQKANEVKDKVTEAADMVKERVANIRGDACA
jgi:gas vesicle protein